MKTAPFLSLSCAHFHSFILSVPAPLPWYYPRHQVTSMMQWVMSGSGRGELFMVITKQFLSAASVYLHLLICSSIVSFMGYRGISSLAPLHLFLLFSGLGGLQGCFSQVCPQPYCHALICFFSNSFAEVSQAWLIGVAVSCSSSIVATAVPSTGYPLASPHSPHLATATHGIAP